MRYEKVVVLNGQGLVVREAQATEAGGVRVLSLQGLPAGLYAVRLFDGQRFVTKQVVKE